jgi:DNA-binding NarL/FixJ family response regulator
VIGVVIVDDQRVVRDGLAMLVGLFDEVEVVGVAADGEEALAVIERERPDVVLMDLNMPGLDGTSATLALRERGSPAGVLVLTTYAEDESLFPALRAGARGYLTKDAGAAEIEQAIRDVAAGRTHLDPLVQERLVAAVSESPQTLRSSGSATDVPAGLTSREVEILRLVAEGLSNGEIARRLVISNATVKTHINHIFQKTGARDRAQAVRFAYEHGLA